MEAPPRYDLLILLTALLFMWLYVSFFESSKYRATPGKLIMGLKVVDVNHERIKFGVAYARFFLKIVSVLILGQGYAMIGWAKDKQGLHDKLCETKVIDLRKTRKSQGAA